MTGVPGPGLEPLRSARGVAFADFDNDGNLDILVNNQNDPPTLLRNDGGNGKIEKLRGLPADQFLVVREGQTPQD